MSNKIIFAVPGSKVFISNYYKNKPNSFLNISVTGSNCSLLCKHCRGLLLKDMIDLNVFSETNLFLNNLNFNSSNDINYAYTSLYLNNIEGILFSGGFNKEGQLPLSDEIIQKIHRIINYTKANFNKNAKFYMHLGFVNKEQVQKLSSLKLDGVFVNIILDKYVIKNIYNLENKKPQDFLENIKILKASELKVSPHIIIGLKQGDIIKEFEEVKRLSKLEIDSLVFAVAKNLYKNHNFISDKNLSLLNVKKIIRLYDIARSYLPKIPIALGCAKPSGLFSENLEIELLKRGIDVISFPSDKTIKYAIDNNYELKFKELCCAFLN